MTTTLPRPGDAIHGLADLAPHAALVAAMVRLAAEDAGAGDPEAAAWLAGKDCHHWLCHIAPSGIDVAAVQRQLMGMAHHASGTPAARSGHPGMPRTTEQEAAR